MPPITIIPIEAGSRTDIFAQMSSQLFKLLRLDEHQIKISIGKKMVNVTIQTVEMKPNEIHFPEYLFQQFSLPIQPYKFLAIYKKDMNLLSLGPIIGLVTDFKHKGKEEPHFGSIHNFCEELHHGITDNGGFLYVFSYTNFSVQGFYFDAGIWKPAELPLPDVIYNRIHSRRLEFGKEYQLFRQTLAELCIPIFNDRFLSKWEVHEHLIHENHLHSYIPDTNIFTKDNLTSFAERYETIFIKPVHGSQGRNIFKLQRENNLFSLESSVTLPLEKNKQSFLLRRYIGF